MKCRWCSHPTLREVYHQLHIITNEKLGKQNQDNMSTDLGTRAHKKKLPSHPNNLRHQWVMQRYNALFDAGDAMRDKLQREISHCSTALKKIGAFVDLSDQTASHRELQSRGGCR
jgi:hypothetical protein